MTGRAPTPKQADNLRVLGSGAIVLAPGRGDWGPLLRRGWVEALQGDDGSRYLPPLRITPAGLRALADAVERDGLPEPFKRGELRQLDESPQVTALKAAVAKLQGERDEARREAQAFRSQVARVRRALRDAA